MYLSNYKNKEGVVIFCAMNDDVHASLKIDGNKQEMNLPKGKWKKVTTSNDVEIIDYSDSEGNVWDLSYDTTFPYSYNELNKELLNCLIKIFSDEADALHRVAQEIHPILKQLSNSNKDSIIANIMNKSMELKKMSAQCEGDLNPNRYQEECDVACVTDEPRSAYSVSMDGGIGGLVGRG